MPDSSQPKILITHPWMGRGGSEATAMWILQALKGDAEVTLLTAAEVDLDDLNAVYGTSVKSGEVTVEKAPRLPGVRSGTQAVRLQNSLFEKHCRKVAPNFDLCVSAYNPVDFGRPGIQMIGDLSFSETLRPLLYPVTNFYHRRSLLRRIYLVAGDALRGRKRPPLAERGDLAVANSQWVAGIMEKHLGVDDPPVTFPPVYLPEPPGQCLPRNPLGFVWMGRISPEKRVEELIGILSQVRSLGFPVELRIGGSFPGTDYSRQISDLIETHREWIEPMGFLDSDQKNALMASQSFSLHGNPAEPFGIAVAEMAAAGCLPFVSAAGGGAREIVTAPELQFKDRADAVEKVVALLEQPDRAEELRQATARSIDRFSEIAFMRRFRSQVSECLGDPRFTRGRPLTLGSPDTTTRRQAMERPPSVRLAGNP